MARIAGINIPLNKRAEIGLTYIYGVGRPTANEVLRKTNIEPDRKVRDLTEDEVSRLRVLRVHVARKVLPTIAVVVLGWAANETSWSTGRSAPG